MYHQHLYYTLQHNLTKNEFRLPSLFITEFKLVHSERFSHSRLKLPRHDSDNIKTFGNQRGTVQRGVTDNADSAIEESRKPMAALYIPRWFRQDPIIVSSRANNFFVCSRRAQFVDSYLIEEMSVSVSPPTISMIRPWMYTKLQCSRSCYESLPQAVHFIRHFVSS